MSNNLKNLVVTIVSDQTIPNIQFLKWYFEINEKLSDLLFISTKSMELKQKSDLIIKGCKKFESFIDNVFKEETDPEDMEKTILILQSFLKNKNYNNLIFNITGGTKLMSLAIYEEAKKYSRTSIFYIPIGKTDFLQIYPEKRNYSLKELLTLQEALEANGVKYKYDNKCLKSWEFNKSIYDRVIKKERATQKKFVNLQNLTSICEEFDQYGFIDFTIKNDNFYSQNNIKLNRITACNFISHFDFNPENLRKEELSYITGAWFEEYVFQYMIYVKKIDPSKIALNVFIEKNKDKNELDVVYLDEANKLNIIECKSFADKDIFYETLYKQQAIKTKFGLAASVSIFTKSTDINYNVINKAKDFGIIITDGNKI